MAEVEIIEIGYGVAHYMDGKIYINKALNKYPKLKAKILDHEMTHVRGEAHSDWKEKTDFNLIAFIVSHPSAWVHELPIWFTRDQGLVYNKQRLLYWSMGLLMTAGWFLLFLWVQWNWEVLFG